MVEPEPQIINPLFHATLMKNKMHICTPV